MRIHCDSDSSASFPACEFTEHPCSVSEVGREPGAGRLPQLAGRMPALPGEPLAHLLQSRANAFPMGPVPKKLPALAAKKIFVQPKICARRDAFLQFFFVHPVHVAAAFPPTGLAPAQPPAAAPARARSVGGLWAARGGGAPPGARPPPPPNSRRSRSMLSVVT